MRTWLTLLGVSRASRLVAWCLFHDPTVPSRTAPLSRPRLVQRGLCVLGQGPCGLPASYWTPGSWAQPCQPPFLPCAGRPVPCSPFRPQLPSSLPTHSGPHLSLHPVQSFRAPLCSQITNSPSFAKFPSRPPDCGSRGVGSLSAVKVTVRCTGPARPLSRCSVTLWEVACYCLWGLFTHLRCGFAF